MLAPDPTAPSRPWTTVAAPFTATPVAQRTAATKPTKRLPGRHLTPRQRRVPGDREADVAAVVLRRQVITAINAGAFDLDAGNMLLTSLNQIPVDGGRQVAFRVDARIPAPYGGPARMIRNARTVLVDELRQLRWTRLDTVPESYGIDEPTVEGRYGTVHTTLRLAVTVPAYQEHALEATASDLLYLDLGRFRRVEPALDRISLWDEDVTSWDDYLPDADAAIDLDNDGWPTVLGCRSDR